MKEPKDIRVNAGDDVIVECIADGLPKPNIKWIGSKGLEIKLTFCIEVYELLINRKCN